MITLKVSVEHISEEERDWITRGNGPVLVDAIYLISTVNWSWVVHNIETEQEWMYSSWSSVVRSVRSKLK